MNNGLRSTSKNSPSAAIEAFCSTTSGATFPLMEKIDANGDDRHPNYEVLIDVTDAEGHRGDVRWNFGESLINADGTITHFGPMIAPDGPALVADIEAGLSSSRAPEQQVGRERGCPSALLTTPDTRAR